MPPPDKDYESWLKQPPKKATPWPEDRPVSVRSYANGPARNTSSADIMKNRMRDLNRRLRAIYEDGGEAYKDATTEDEICKRFRQATSIRKTHVQQILNQIDLAKNVDLCFLVDITSSMAPHFDATRNAIFQIVDHLLKSDGQVRLKKIRLGFVGYRDHCDSKQFEKLAFTQSVDEFRQFCQNIVCTGGGDDCEDVFGGLEQAIQMGWDVQNSGTRLVFHLCDCPAHGRDYNQGLADSYPCDDPKGRKHGDLFKQMDDRGIQYNFGKITDFTNQMIKKFEEGRAEKINVFDVKDLKNIASSVVTAVHGSVWASTKRATMFKDKRLREREYSFVHEEPDWSKLKVLKGTFLAYAPPKEIDDIVEDIPMERLPPKTAKIKVAGKPFSKGVERVAYYGRDLSFSSQIVDVVFKEFALEYADGVARRFEISNQVQNIAAFLATRFCEEYFSCTKRSITIEFLKTKTLVIQQGDGTIRYLACEKRFAAGAQFIRFTNNADYAILESKAQELGIASDNIDLLMAFSHWTYQATDQMLMVVDLQGILHRDSSTNKIVLTDPAIHCVDLTRYGCTNLGSKEIDKFFSNHKCNTFCKSMGLKNKK